MEQIKDAIEKLEVPELREKYRDEERQERRNDAETARQRREQQKHYRDIQRQHDRVK